MKEVRLKSKDGEKVIGVIVDLYDGTGAHDTLDIKLNDDFAQTLDTKEEKTDKKKAYVLVPFVRDIVPVVDTKEKFCVISPPQGLLETCIYRKKK